MVEMIKVKVWIKTDKVGSKCETTLPFSKEEWAELDDDDKEEACKDAAFDMIEWGFEEVK